MACGLPNSEVFSFSTGSKCLGLILTLVFSLPKVTHTGRRQGDRARVAEVPVTTGQDPLLGYSWSW